MLFSVESSGSKSSIVGFGNTTMNRMRTGTSQSANIGLTDCRTKMVLSFSAVVMRHFSWYIAYNPVTCRLGSEKTKRQDASSKLIKSRATSFITVYNAHTQTTWFI